MVNIKVLFDETQKERGRIFTNFRILANDLEQMGIQVGVYDSYPIKYSAISKADVFVLLCPDGSKLYANEVKGLLRFVEEGGSLAIFSEAGGDKGHNTNLNALLKHFQIELISNQVFDYTNFDVGFESCPIIKKIYKHPITENVKELTFVSGCSLNIGVDVIELARTENTSDPPSATVMALARYGKGKVFVSGSYLMFSDRKIGISLRDNRIFAQNLFKWLANIDIDSTIGLPTPVDKELPVKPTTEAKSITEAKTTIKEKITTHAPEETEQKTVSKEVSERFQTEGELSSEDIEKAINIIKKIQAEVDSQKIDDPGFREIILTAKARELGIDYTKIAPYIEKREEKEIQEPTSKTKSTKTESIEETSKSTFPVVDTRSIPKPSEEKKLEIEAAEIESKLFEAKEETEAVKEPQLVEAIKSIKQSIEVLSAQLVLLLGDIVMELSDIRKLLEERREK